MLKSHIIWGNYPETEVLIEDLRHQELNEGIITVIDYEMKSSLKRRGDIVYASKEYVENAGHSLVTEFHYSYIGPFRRKDGVAWEIKKVIGLIHEFSSYKRY